MYRVATATPRPFRVESLKLSSDAPSIEKTARLTAFSYAIPLLLLLAAAIECAILPQECAALDEVAQPFTRRLWRAQDGLPDQTVQAIAQTHDGYLWIGTKGGLLRFDGANFVIYDHTNTPGLTEGSVNCLFVSRDGSLWIGTEGGGLVRYRDTTFRTYPASDGSSDSFVRAIFEDHRGVLWVGGDQGLFQLHGDKLERMDGTGRVPSIFVRAIVEDHNNLWIGGTTLLQLSKRGVREFPLPGGPSANLITSMLSARDSTLWVGTLGGLHSLSATGVLRKKTGVRGTVQVLRESQDGSLWIGTLGRGVYILRRDALSALPAPEVLPSNTVLAILEDSERNMWLGTQAGLLRLTDSPIAITLFPGASDSQFETIYGDRDGSVWACSNHLFHIRDGTVKAEVFPAIGDVRVRTLLRDHHGDLWIGTDGKGLFHLVAGRAIRFTSPTIANDFIRVLLQARDGTLWAGTDGGLSHLTGSAIMNYNTPNGLSYFSVTALLEDHAGDLWIGTSRGLSHRHAGAFVNDSMIAALKHEKIWSIHEDLDHGLWIGTSNGLYSFRSGTLAHLTSAQGLAGNVIYQILEDSSAHLWLSGPNDVSRVDRHVIEAELRGHGAVPPSLTLYPISKDFESAELFGGMQPAGFISPQQAVWFPSNKGPVHIQVPRQPSASRPSFSVVIDRVLADGLAQRVQPSVVIAPGDGRLEISFAAILLRSQEALRYRYKLEGFDRDWNESSTRRTAYYTNLPPGHYQFRVAAYEISNPSAPTDTAIEIIQRPHFYRTTWFLLVSLAGLLLSALAIHRYRVRQVSMRFRAVLEERNRMAREMHDTVVQDCIGLSSLLEAVSSSEFRDKRLSHELVDQAREQVRTTIDEARSAVWNLRHRETSMEDAGALIRELVAQMQSRLAQLIFCRVSGEPFPLPHRITHELVMIVREALWNAHTHASPARIEVRVTFEKDRLIIDVTDDGTGFDLAAASPERHYGLTGMRERAEKLGGELRIETQAGNGTTVSLWLPRGARSRTGAVQEVNGA